MSNPYVTVQGPNYGAGLMNWQGMLNPQQGQANKPPGQPQPGQPGQPQGGAPGQPGSPLARPMDTRPPAQGGQSQGWGAQLAQMFGLGPAGGQAAWNAQARPQQFGGPQPMVPTAQGPTGLY